MKDRHLLLALFIAAFLGAMFLVTDLAATSGVSVNRSTRDIPQDLSEDLGLTECVEVVVEDDSLKSPLSLTVDQSELERLDTLLREMSEIQPLIDENTESRILIGASYMQ